MRALRYFFYPCAVALAAVVVVEADEADRLFRLAAGMQSVSGATRLAWASLLERLSFSWYTGATDLAEAYAHIVADATRAANRATLAALLMALGALVHYLALACGRARNALRLAWHLNLGGLLAFAIGIRAPMLTVVAHAQVPVLGEVILRHETKSILSTVGGLAGSGDWLLAGVIAAFSIVLPVLKVILVGVVVAVPRADVQQRGSALLHTFGKWSMADVFVVAVLVAYLAMNTDVQSTARVGLGLYFFTTYCLMSMCAAALAARGVRAHG